MFFNNKNFSILFKLISIGKVKMIDNKDMNGDHVPILKNFSNNKRDSSDLNIARNQR